MAPSPYTPAQTAEMISRLGVMKARLPLHITILSAISAGCLLSFAAATLLSVNTSPWFQQNAPGMIRMVGAAVFPYGLVLITMTGAELCTGSFLYTTVACLHGRLSISRMLAHWALAFIGNLAGALFMVAIIFGCMCFCYSPRSISITLGSDTSARCRNIRIRPLPIRDHYFRTEEATRADFSSDPPPRYRLRLAGRSRPLLVPSST